MLKHLSGSIFWKIFVGFWVTILIVTALAWSISADWHEAPQNYGAIEKGPDAQRAVNDRCGQAHCLQYMAAPALLAGGAF